MTDASGKINEKSPTTLVIGIGGDRFGLTDYDVVGIDQIAKIRVSAGAPAV